MHPDDNDPGNHYLKFVAIHPAGESFVTLALNGNLRYWTAETGPQVDAWHFGQGTERIAITKNGCLMILNDRSLAFYDHSTRDTLMELEKRKVGSIFDVELADDGEHFFVVDAKFQVRRLKIPDRRGK